MAGQVWAVRGLVARFTKSATAENARLLAMLGAIAQVGHAPQNCIFVPRRDSEWAKRMEIPRKHFTTLNGPTGHGLGC